MFHLAAYTESLAASSFNQIDALADRLLTRQNNNFIMPRDMSIIYVAALCVDLQRVSLTTASYRGITPPFVRPFEDAAVPPTNPQFANYFRNPLRVPALEELQVDAFQDNAAAQRITVGVALQSVFRPAPGGDIYTLRGTGTTTVVANVWTTAAITWANALPRGRYAVVGMAALSANGILARLFFDNQQECPGTPCYTDEGNVEWQLSRMGYFGVWGEFDSWAMPQIEFLCNAADTAQTVYLDVIRIG